MWAVKPTEMTIILKLSSINTVSFRFSGDNVDRLPFNMSPTVENKDSIGADGALV